MVIKYFKLIFSRQVRLLFFGLVLTGTPCLADSFSAHVDRTTLSANESLTLTVTYSGQTMDEPDFSALENDFEISSRQQQRQLSFGFGNNDSSSVQWILTLLPRKTGNLLIPSFHFKGQVSDAIQIKVTQAKASSDPSRSIFLETELEKERAVVDSQVLYTLRLNTSVMLSSVDIPELDIAGARTLKVNDAQYQKTINGREFVVVEMQYAIFPERPGKLTLPSLRITGLVPNQNSPFGGLGTRGKPVVLTSDEKHLTVDPIPEDAPQPWVPARGLSISQRWSNDTDKLKVGEPVTRTITVTAQGLTGAQIPPLKIDTPSGLKIYPDQPEITETLSESGSLGTRTESYAIVPTAAGELELPPITVRWWDTEANLLRETTLKGVRLSVSPGPQVSADAESAPVPAESDSQDNASSGSSSGTQQNRLLYGSLFFNGLLLIAVIALGLFYIRRPPPALAVREQVKNRHEESEKSAFRAITKYDPQQLKALREQILQWARLYWHDNRITILDDIVRKSGDRELHKLFTTMDSSLYGNGSSSEVDVAAIISRLKRIRTEGITPAQTSALKPLYPERAH